MSDLKEELSDVRRQLEEANMRLELDKKQAEKAAQVSCLFLEYFLRRGFLWFSKTSYDFFPVFK